MREAVYLPAAEQTAEAAAFAEETLLSEGCPTGLVMKLNVVFDELFSNIVLYSGAAQVCVACGVEEGCAVLRFSDDGIPYDPTAAGEPDIALPAEEREIGGLGILMARKLTDELTYAFEDGKNVLTAYKRIL